MHKKRMHTSIGKSFGNDGAPVGRSTQLDRVCQLYILSWRMKCEGRIWNIGLNVTTAVVLDSTFLWRSFLWRSFLWRSFSWRLTFEGRMKHWFERYNCCSVRQHVRMTLVLVTLVLMTLVLMALNIWGKNETWVGTLQLAIALDSSFLWRGTLWRGLDT